MKRVCVVGAGYVGLVTGACLADLGNDVTCLDVVEEKITRLQAGKLPIYEPGLHPIVRRNADAGRLRFTTSYAEGVPGAEFVFIAVNTPTVAGGDGADMTYVEAAARAIALHATGDTVIVNKSTMPVGSGDLVSAIVHEHLARHELHVAVVSNPEFLREGSAVRDFRQPDRIVLGSTDRDAAGRVAQLYLPLRAPIMITDLYTAEMIKYASNAFLATKISFINEMARICDRLGADVTEVAAGMGYDKRIGRAFLNAGLGFGGSCFEAGETVFALNSPNVATERLDTLFARSGTPACGETVEVVTPERQRVLAFDLATGQPTLATVTALTRRPYRGTMVTITTTMGRSLRVTADHPVVVANDGHFALLPATAIAPGDHLMALTALPYVEEPLTLDLIDLLRDTALEAAVSVAPVDGSFTARYHSFAAIIPPELLRSPDAIRRHNRMPLRVYRYLTEAGALDTPHQRLRISTAKGAATMINAVIPVDADLMRLCGYYLAEGFLSRDPGREHAVRERIGFCFHEDEHEYTEDVRRILGRWGLTWLEGDSPHTRTTLVSSRVFVWLIRDVLRCGIRSEDKALPRLAFNVRPELRRALIRGAFSGDGAVTTIQDGKNLMLEYATVGKTLADGMALLLQTLGILPAIDARRMNTSTQPAYILRISGYDQVHELRDAFDEKRRPQIERVLASDQRHIQPHGFARHGTYVTLAVREVTREAVETMVYSLETTTGTLIASSGLISHNCFPKDVKALSHMAAEAGLHPQMLEAVMKINDDQRHLVVAKLEEGLGSAAAVAQATVAVLGLAFKDNTDDMREAAAIDVVRWLRAAGAEVRAFDPVAMPAARALLPRDGVTYCADEYAAAAGCDAVVIVTEWESFRALDLARLAEVMRQRDLRPVLVDGRNLFDPAEVRRHGFRYLGIGHGAERHLTNGTDPADSRGASPAALGDAPAASRARTLPRAHRGAQSLP